MKLGMKLLAAPLLTAVLVLLAGQINTFLMGHVAEKGLSISRASVDDFKTVASVQQQMGQLHTSVYKTVALIDSRDEAKVKAFRADVATQLVGVKRVSGALAPFAGGHGRRAVLVNAAQTGGRIGARRDGGA